jgi:hypothetical protein
MISKVIWPCVACRVIPDEEIGIFGGFRDSLACTDMSKWLLATADTLMFVSW